MSPREQLSEFVGQALESGHDRAAIEKALREAGWTEAEVARALQGWAETDFRPPVPRPQATVSARETFLYGLLFVALGVTVFSVIRLGFELIEQFLPQLDEGSNRWSRDTIRWSIANLVVFFPVFLFLAQRVERLARLDPSHRRSAVRKWFGHIAGFLAAVTLLGVLVAVVYSLLDGALTARFLAKAALTAVTAGLVLLFIRDMVREPGDGK